MAEEETMASSSSGEDEDVFEQQDLSSMLASQGRDFLIRNNGDQVKISELEGKIIGLYFSGSWCGPCRRFTPILVEAYKELASRESNFEIIFVSADRNDAEFDAYFSEMPWLAIPLSDAVKRRSLNQEFDVEGIPTLVIFDENGEFLTDEAVEVVRDYGAEGYPFTEKKIEKLEEEMEAAKINQTITSLLVTSSRDYLVTSNFKKIPISEIEGKVVGLYFTLSSFEACAGFTRRLVNVYNDLKGRKENFEIVLVSLEEDEASFMDDFEDMPWLGIPFKDKLCEKLVRYFDLEDLPTLAVIGTDGKTINANAAELVEDYGVEAYPFTSKKLKELRKKEKAMIESQTLESLLVSGEKNYVIKKAGVKVPISDLVGKNILFYFSAHWCPPCRAFLPLLTEVYNHIKETDGAFEIIFVSSDEDEESFNDYFSHMPWLALPFWDERIRFLSRVFKISGIPSCVAISPEGKTITKDARNLIMEYGADAYPFTKEQIRQLKAEMEEKAKRLPEKIRHKLHRHVLWKSRREYICNGCGKSGRDWSFCCKRCDFDFHPGCALDDDHKIVDSDDDDEVAAWPKKIKHMLHKHALVKAWRHYQCDACGIIEKGWSYYCEVCDFDLHPVCALGNKTKFKMINDNDGLRDEDEDDDEDDEDDDDDDDDNYDSNDGDKTRYDDDEHRDVENEHASLSSRHFKQAIQLVDDTDDEDDENEHRSLISRPLKQIGRSGDSVDGEEEEEKDKKIGDDNEDDDGDEADEEDDRDEDDNEENDEEEDEDEDDNEENDEEEDEDGPGMKGYVCNTRDREGSESFQESIFTCKLK